MLCARDPFWQQHKALQFMSAQPDTAAGWRMGMEEKIRIPSGLS